MGKRKKKSSTKKNKPLGKLIRVLIGMFLIPICIGISIAFINEVFKGKPLSNNQSIFFGGIIFYLLIHFIFKKPILAYVFGHELTHLLWGLVFGGKVKGFKVSRGGGSVTLTKSNFLVTLAPYFFPIYTYIVIGIFFTCSYFSLFNIHEYVQIFIFLIGFTWGFHLALTFHSLKQSQSDILETGNIFSLPFIYCANIVILVIILSLISHNVSFISFSKSTINTTSDVFTAILSGFNVFLYKLISLLKKVKFD